MQPAGRQLVIIPPSRYNISRALKSEVELLRQHLDMAAVLCRNSVVRPLALLRDSSSCTDTMGKLFSAVLARHLALILIGSLTFGPNGE